VTNGKNEGKKSQIERAAQARHITNKQGFLTSLRRVVSRSRLGHMLVRKNVISQGQLDSVLEKQAQSKVPLGRLLVQENLISRTQLHFILGRQFILRASATCLLAFAAATSMKGKSAKADYITDVPAKISISMTSEFSQMAAYPALFGTAEKSNKNLKPFTKWTGMFKRFDRSLQSASGQRTMNKMKQDLQHFKGQPLVAMAAGINKMMNKKPYIVDSKLWGQSDYWATPVEFMTRGGDCEDYAIAKYTALRALGVPEERLRIAIVQDLKKNIPHAVLIVYTDEGPYALDNQNSSLVNGSRLERYKPIFSINRQAWWLHTAPDNGTMLASAN